MTAPKARRIAFLEAPADFFEAHQRGFQVLLTRFSNLTEPRPPLAAQDTPSPPD